jgi:hypothetical protein
MTLMSTDLFAADQWFQDWPQFTDGASGGSGDLMSSPCVLPVHGGEDVSQAGSAVSPRVTLWTVKLADYLL